jgi:hypothetical protein
VTLSKVRAFEEYNFDHDEIAHASRAFEDWKAERDVSAWGTEANLN